MPSAPRGPSGSAVARETPGSNDPLQPVQGTSDLSHVFHRLNNQLGVVLANAELLESRLTGEGDKARAGQVVAGTLEVIATIQDLRRAVAFPPTTPRQL
jgi:hypothetical protein